LLLIGHHANHFAIQHERVVAVYPFASAYTSSATRQWPPPKTNATQTGRHLRVHLPASFVTLFIVRPTRFFIGVEISLRSTPITAGAAFGSTQGTKLFLSSCVCVFVLKPRRYSRLAKKPVQVIGM